MKDGDTIAAIATAAGGGVGILRLSGPRAVAIAQQQFNGLSARTAARRMVHGWWCDAGGAPLDEGLAVVMPGPDSFTGEDVAEIHLHGGALNLQRCLAVCWEVGARPADPGEFSRRAFLNGKIDLTRAEAIADLVAARTDRALRQARGHLRGGLYDAATTARDQILRLRAHIEVDIDFSDEDVAPIDPQEIASGASEVADGLRALAATFQRGRLWRDGARVVLAGRPNAGKSSLFNALLAEDRAIVTAIPGTTRDTVEETLDILGVPVVLVDTAGLRETGDVVEAAGVARAERQVASADLVLHLVDVSSDATDERVAGAVGAPVLRVCSKADLHDAPGDGIAVSAVTGAGLDTLRVAIVQALGGEPGDDGGLTITRERHHLALCAAATALETAAMGLGAGQTLDLVAVDIQEATDALAELVGVTSIEDVLDVLFSTFCIGK